MSDLLYEVNDHIGVITLEPARSHEFLDLSIVC